jgi:hypothetical protein
MMRAPRFDLTGQRFGKLSVVERGPSSSGRGGVRWHCRCDCGAMCLARVRVLRSGKQTSCLSCAKTKAPLYVTPNCGIEVIGEFPTTDGRYIRCNIRPHPFFSGTTVLRSRVVMTDALGRKLLRSEHVHHGKKGRHDDSPGNLEVLTAAKHNQHHKTGSKHRPESKRKIADSLRETYAAGRRRAAWQHLSRTDKGRFAS